MKVLIISDLHFGEKGDDPRYNEHLLTLLEDVSNYAIENNITTCVQLGDWFHNRNRVQVSTLAYAIKGAIILAENFHEVYVLAGNHDLFYKDRLDTSSLAALDAYVTVVDKPTTAGNVLLCPWIVDGEMWDEVCDASKTHDYLLAHLELSGFKLNEAYVLEHGYSHKELKGYKRVISGHYHSKQEKDNITYCGTPIPITFNEANEEHGWWVLDTDTNSLEFVKYDRVKVISIPYDEIESISDYDPDTTTIRIEFPDDLDDETLVTDVNEYLKEKGFHDYKVKFKSSKTKEILNAVTDSVDCVENIDEVVKSFLSGSFSVDGIDKTLLTKYYDLAIKLSEDKQ
jgi:DNA repair exonuclease SbcCD nuclease subunit